VIPSLQQIARQFGVSAAFTVLVAAVVLTEVALLAQSIAARFKEKIRRHLAFGRNDHDKRQ
jgi:hypothetical protein